MLQFMLELEKKGNCILYLGIEGVSCKLLIIIPFDCIEICTRKGKNICTNLSDMYNVNRC